MSLLELIGVAAFAVTGAMAAMEVGADIFGVLFLSLVTALGGGIIRDLLLGDLPPRMFTSFAYVTVALVSALALFLGALRHKDTYLKSVAALDHFVNFFDAMGLGLFTVTGVQLAAEKNGLDNPLLLCMMGMTTGIGGGMLRDTMIGRIPKVLRKRIYAVASLAGALCYWVLQRAGLSETLSAVPACVLVLALRILATHYQWNLPRVQL